MNYKISPGYVMIKICDTNLLVAKRENWEKNPRVRPISKKYAICWALMEKGRTSDEVVQSMSELFNRPSEAFAEKFAPVFQKLAETGYLMEVPEQE